VKEKCSGAELKQARGVSKAFSDPLFWCINAMLSFHRLLSLLWYSALLESVFRFNKVAFGVSGFDEIMIFYTFQLLEQG